MDDDELHDSGFGGLAMYQLGRWSAESSASAQDLASSLFGPKQLTVDVNQLLADHRTLAAENARLRQDLADYKLNYERLHQWAQKASRDLKRFRGEAD